MSDHIPLAIQADIMKRLPTKSLLRFRSVSKPWKSLIDSPEFIADYSFNQQHLLVSYKVPRNLEQKFVSVVDDDTFPQRKFSLHVPIPRLGAITVLGSSRGLFALYNITGDPIEPGRIIKTIVLWNPSIRKSVAIDVSDVEDPHSKVVFGFGVCPHTNDPKLVRIDPRLGFSNADTFIFTPRKIELFTLSSGAWRSIPTINQPRNSTHLMWEQVVINEFIYWHAVDGNINISMLTYGFKGYNLIVSYDMTSERFMEVSLPDTLARAFNHAVIISKLKDSLGVVEIVEEAGKLVYGVWMMEHGVSNSFAKLFNVNSPDASIPEILGFWKNNEPVFAMRTDYNAEDVFVHELPLDRIKFLEISGNGYEYCSRSYVETLLLLDH